MKPGELYIVDFGSRPTGRLQAGKRPALVVHSKRFTKVPGLALFCPTTMTPRPTLPFRVAVRQGEGGLDEDSYVMTEQVRIMPLFRVGPRIGRLPDDVFQEALRYVHAFTA